MSNPENEWPLSDWHSQAQAEYQDYFGTSIVSTYGRLPIEYASMYRSAGVFDMAQRGVISVTGEDRASFLNSLLTAELVERDSGKSIPPGQARFSFLLDRKGRVLAEMNVLVADDRILLELDRRLIADVSKELERYHFREKVDFTADDDLSVIGVLGPGAARLVREATGIDAVELQDNTGRTSGSVSAWRTDLGTVAMYLVVVPRAELVATWGRLVADEKSAVAIGWAALNAVRIEACRGVFGIDYDNTFLPAETGQLERAVSFTKGCYPGQEIVARMHARNQYARKLVQLKMNDDMLPVAGAKVYDQQGNEVGGITSSTISPRNSGIAIALAIVRREVIDAGKEIQVPAEGDMRPAAIA